ncbi:GNAT family N-acetyltransferase [Streptomyces sp. NPDC056683]|uniref:GNAT family N-acetyltransferase n=1 Tax=Streptomyces sp. NPDC056683 TaxID=3345910 RepID=UPI0036A5BBCA
MPEGAPLPEHCVLPLPLATITRTVIVAAGRFAPGHLGELTPMVPFELVDAVLSETRTVQRRLRDLPSRVGVYFLLAMCLFPEVGYRLVWAKLTAGLPGIAVVRPSTKALRGLRRRLGSTPVRALFEVLAGPLARPTTSGVRFGPYRTVSFDGCSSIKVPDSERNRGWLGRCPHGGCPQVELMTLVETGTRAVIAAVFGPTREGETSGPDGVTDYVDAYASSFGVGRTLQTLVIDAESNLRTDLGRLIRLVGRIDGRAVATSAVLLSNGVAGVYWVGTHPTCRGRGIGAALTAAAMVIGRRHGALVCTLQASDLGAPVYQRLGFTQVSEVVLYSPPSGL